MAVPSWITSLSDPLIRADTITAYGTGTFSEQGLSVLFSDLVLALSQGNTTLSTSQFNDLKTIASNINTSNASPYVVYITNALVNGNPANVTYTGGSSISAPLGNLAIGSTATVLNQLDGKWFLGADLPLNFYQANNKDNPDTHTPASINFIYTHTPLLLVSSFGAPSFNDVNQGMLGDCYLLASLAEVAQQNPTQLNNMIIDNGNGSYGVRFFVNGIPEYVTTSASFASSIKSPSWPLFNQFPIPGDIWVNLVENAYAQIQTGGNITGTSDTAANSFSLIDFGSPVIAVAQITGATQVNLLEGLPTSQNWHLSTFTNQGSRDGGNFTSSAVLQQIADALAGRNDVVITSQNQVIGFNGYSTLETSHIMSVIGVDTDTNNLIIRNPWGTRVSQYNSWQTVFEVSVNTLASYGDYITIDNAGTITAPSYSISGVNNWYQSVQFQSPAVTTIANIVNQLNAGTLAQANVWSEIMSSPYTTSNVNPVITTYEVLYGRIPDQGGEQYWVGQMAAGATLQNIYFNFGQSPEFQNIYNSTGSAIATLSSIKTMYEHAFGKVDAQADLTGESWWFSQNLPNWEVAYNIGTSAQAASYMNLAIHGYELTQIAGNSGTIPMTLSIYNFGGGPA